MKIFYERSVRFYYCYAYLDLLVLEQNILVDCPIELTSLRAIQENALDQREPFPDPKPSPQGLYLYNLTLEGWQLFFSLLPLHVGLLLTCRHEIALCTFPLLTLSGWLLLYGSSSVAIALEGPRAGIVAPC